MRAAICEVTSTEASSQRLTEQYLKFIATLLIESSRVFVILKSIADLHGLGIVHLDVKPSNFCGDLLLDYGLSTFAGMELSPKVATLNYKSPELCEDRWSEGGGEAVDMWAAACVIYEIVRAWLKESGYEVHKRRRLFNGKGKDEVRRQQRKFFKR